MLINNRIDINKEILSTYTDAQLTQWAKDNALTEAEFKAVLKALSRKPPKSLAEERPPED